MLVDFGIFISLVCILLCIIVMLNARWIVRCIDNSKDLENKMVGKIKIICGVIGIIALWGFIVLLNM